MPGRARWSRPLSRGTRAGAAPLGDQIAGYGLGAAIHRRGVDHPTAGFDERPQHLGEFLARRVAGTDIEYLPGAEPDHRHRLAARRDRARDHCPGHRPGSGRHHSSASKQRRARCAGDHSENVTPAHRAPTAPPVRGRRLPV